MTEAAEKRGVGAWLQLVRVPNLFTVPGDVIAGWLLVNGAGAKFDAHVAALVASSVLFYAGGLILNDVSDYETDLKERPNRPLPSGRIGKNAALWVMIVCFAGALALARFASVHVFQCGLILTALIVLYNQQAKKHPVGGPVVMGLCRGFNLLLGACLAPTTIFPKAAWICAAIETLYIFRVTSLARRETEGGKITPKTIGALISLLLPIQAAFCIASGAGKLSWAAAALLLACWPLHRVIARRFYAS
jgi:4-hydroxybenzoate polyprenyltransferase